VIATTVLAAPVRAEEFHAPGLDLFTWPPLWHGAPAWLAKPALLAAVSSLLVIVFFFAAFARPQLVPRGRMQNLGEMGYEFVRDQVARPMIGKDGDRWMPFLLSLFFFVWMCNLMGVLPIIFQFPVMSRIAFPVFLAVMVWVIAIYLGIKHQGPVGLIKNVCFPPGLQPRWVYVLVAPIEFISTFILRHATHAVRLFANMMAGHLLLAVFAIVGYHFLYLALSPLGAPVGVLGVAMTILMTGFEMFIQFLQAYVFVFLAAMFIGEALHPQH
jgi:F-type H+-transporting ATPase subunit a